MRVTQHAQFTFEALRRWFVAQCLDSLFVGLLWMAALFYLSVPWAFLWGLLAMGFQFIPHFGPLLTLIGPTLALLFSGAGWERLLELLIAYAVVVIVDGLFLQPWLMKRQNRVPIWASLIVPIVLGIVIPFWGVLLAPPLLAVVYAYRARMHEQRQAEAIRAGEGVVLPPEGSGQNSGNTRF